MKKITKVKIVVQTFHYSEIIFKNIVYYIIIYESVDIYELLSMGIILTPI